MEYPKIETLYDRDIKTFKVMPDKLRMPEFGIINCWHITEKIDGTNIRVAWSAKNKELTFSGRTDNAQMPTKLLEYLQKTFKPEIFDDFDEDIILFGEGYGEKIQKGGGNYRKNVAFRLFDILIGTWWLEIDNIQGIADRFNIKTVPNLGMIKELPRSKDELIYIAGPTSLAAHQDGGDGLQPEGIVARSYPLLFCRNGTRVIWKLKFKDF